ncbi:HD domain-containing protein [Pseudomonas aeruginosa]|uniref:HD domain-containing protein n=1 Tax=Pseudomonas aeruginosa TaxID=287 RepID=UPI00374825A6
MNILLVSQCEKRALSETRRILDQFAERRGERTWQTPITQAGLDTLRRLLKKSARRNTAVACHWIRGRDHSELLWIVGDASRFNAQGAVPTNRTRRDILRKEDENDWHSAEDIRLLTVMAALFHDIGKASQAFQAKLRNRGKPMADAYRHEWVSLRLFEAFVGPAAATRTGCGAWRTSERRAMPGCRNWPGTTGNPRHPARSRKAGYRRSPRRSAG